MDTGTGASISDRGLLPIRINLAHIIQCTEPVTLRGMCGSQIADEVVKVDIRLGGGVSVPVEAYLVDNLAADFLIG